MILGPQTKAMYLQPGSYNYNSERCINGNPAYDGSTSFGFWNDNCCYIDSRKDSNDLNDKTQDLTINFDGYYNVTGISVWFRDRNRMSKSLTFKIHDS